MNSSKTVLTSLMILVTGSSICFTDSASTLTPFVKANNFLAINLQKELAEKGKNLCFSPFSISVALTMLYNGAKSSTSKEMRKVLGYDGTKLCKRQINADYKKILSSLNSSSECIFDIGNALTLQEGFDIRQCFKKILVKSYSALVQNVDFAKDPQGAMDTINNFIETVTHGLIEKMLQTIRSDTTMVLTNAIYFKGSWLKKFNETDTKPDTFYNNGDVNNGTKIPMMHQLDYFRYKNYSTFSAIELPYDCNISMFLLLPHEKDGLEDLEKTLTYDSIRSINDTLRSTKVRVTIPRFHSEYTATLNNALIKLGMFSAFTSKANFKCLSNSNGLVVSEVIHKTVIEVNEEGTEAAAVTVVIIRRTAMLLAKFEADHPFIYCIVNNDGRIIFTGRISNFY